MEGKPTVLRELCSIIEVVVLAERIAKSAKYVTSWYYTKYDSTCALKYQDDCLRFDPPYPTEVASPSFY